MKYMLRSAFNIPSILCLDRINHNKDDTNEFISVTIILCLFLVLFFYRTIFFGLVPSSSDMLQVLPVFESVFESGNVSVQNGLFSDVVRQFEPWLWYNTESYRHLFIPLWNPYSGAGVPHLANMQSIVFFFMVLSIYAFGLSKYTLLIYYFIKLYLTGIFTFYYLRSINLDFKPSLIGAVAFMFIGFNIVWLYWPISNLMFLLPLFFLIIEKMIKSPRDIKFNLFLALSVAIGVFAGHPETFFHISVISFLYISFKLLKQKSELHNKIRIMEKYTLFFIAGIALSAIQLIPFLEYLFNSYAWATRTLSSIPPLDWHNIILNIMPDYYGSPSIYFNFPYLFSFINYNETTAGYIGVSLICLALYTVISNYKEAIVQFYLLVFSWAFSVVYGVYPIYNITIALPLFSHAANNRMLFLLGFCLIVLGSIGIDRLLNIKIGWRGELKRLIFSSIILIGIMLILIYFNFDYISSYIKITEFIIFNQFNQIIFTISFIVLTLLISFIILFFNKRKVKNVAVIVLLLLVFLETGIHGLFYLPAIDEKYFNIDSEGLKIAKDGLYRATSIAPIPYFEVYPVNTQIKYSVYDIRDYDALEIKYYWDLLNIISKRDPHDNRLLSIDHRFLDFMGVKWIYSFDDLSRNVDIFINVNADKNGEWINTTALGEMKDGFVIEQEFTSNQSNLSKIDFLLATYGKNGVQSNLTFILFDKSSNTPLRMVIFNTSNVKDYTWNSIEFYPLSDSMNKTYILRITGDGKPGSSVTLWKNDLINPDTIGNLSINNNHVQGVLCFKTYYDNGLFSKRIQKNGYYIFENTNALPRAFIVQNVTFEKNNSIIIDKLLDPSFDWTSSAILYGDSHPIDVYKNTINKNLSANVYIYEPNYICMKANGPGYLILTDTYYPGWNAYVNGNKVDIYRANYAFRAVALESYDNIVEFRYEPISFYFGIAITIYTLFILVIYYLYTKRFKFEN